MKIIRNISRLLVGLVFIFSGFVKVVDPLGSAYKFTDYFVAMGLDFLSGAALPFAIFMSVAEMVIGMALVFNLVPKLAAWGVLLFMGFFTPLTLWLAVANPVSDCGCFGDAIILTNWQTFYKNIVLLLLTLIIFICRKKFKPPYIPALQWTLGIVFALSALWLSLYCLRNLPVVDFRPYYIGANIKEGIAIPESEKDNRDVYEDTFVYKKDGKQQAFTIDEIPDTTWTFVEAQHKLIKKGYVPPIHDFTIKPVLLPGISPEPVDDNVNVNDIRFVYANPTDTSVFHVENLPRDPMWKLIDVEYDTDIDPDYIDFVYTDTAFQQKHFSFANLPDTSYKFYAATYMPKNQEDAIPYGEDITETVLNDKNYAFLAVMTSVDDVDTKHLDKLDSLFNFCQRNNYKLYCLTGSLAEEIADFASKNGLTDYQFYNTDPITLKTIVRSNPGIVLLQNGTILNKWSAKNIPDIATLANDLTANSITQHNNTIENYLIVIYILSLVLFMTVFTVIYKWLVRNKYINIIK